MIPSEAAEAIARHARLEAAMAAFEGKGTFRQLLLADRRIATVITADELEDVPRPSPTSVSCQRSWIA